VRLCSRSGDGDNNRGGSTGRQVGGGELLIKVILLLVLLVVILRASVINGLFLVVFLGELIVLIFVLFGATVIDGLVIALFLLVLLRASIVNRLFLFVFFGELVVLSSLLAIVDRLFIISDREFIVVVNGLIDLAVFLLIVVTNALKIAVINLLLLLLLLFFFLTARNLFLIVILREFLIVVLLLFVLLRAARNRFLVILFIILGRNSRGRLRDRNGSRRLRSVGLSSLGGRRGVAARSTGHGEVNARLVGLINIRGIPEPLQNTVARGGAVAAEIVGEGDAESGVVGSQTTVAGIVVELDQRGSNDGISAGLNHGHVGEASVRSSNVDIEVDRLAQGEALDIVDIIVVLETLAEPEIASSGVQVITHDLQDTLDIAVDVGGLLGERLLTASSGEGIARASRSR
jgi:hypothetical protein